MTEMVVRFRRVGTLTQEWGDGETNFGVHATDIVECGRCFALISDENIAQHILWHGLNSLENWGDDPPSQLRHEIVGPEGTIVE